MVADAGSSVPHILLVVTPGGALDTNALVSGSAFHVSVVPADAVSTMHPTDEHADVIVLSVGSANGTSVGLVQALRHAKPLVPLLVHVLSARDDEIETLLEIGADDCVVAPISPQLLRTRIRVLLRRAGVNAPASLAIGDLSIEQSTHSLIGPDGRVHLTQREFGLLVYLLLRQRTVVSRSELLLRVWGYEFDPGTSVLDVTISRVRRKISAVGGQVTLRSIRGIGFMIHSGQDPLGPVL